MDYITARIKGRSQNQYEVTVDYDIEVDKISEINCECPAFESYNGICKHCVATLLEYVNNKEQESAQTKLVFERNNALEQLKSMKLWEQANRGTVTEQSKDSTGSEAEYSGANCTSCGFTAQEYSEATADDACYQAISGGPFQEKNLDLLPTSEYGGVRLEPILRCTASQLNIEFRIGVSQMYVLKDVFEFGRALENRENIRL